jgi:hypothetical protein
MSRRGVNRPTTAAANRPGAPSAAGNAGYGLLLGGPEDERDVEPPTFPLDGHQ